MQFTDVPPTLKPPLTVAFAIGKLFESVTVAMTLARHVPNFETITEGKVYKSGVIPPDEIADYVKKYHIKSIVDLRFPGRYGYAEELAKMGMKYDVQGDLLVIHGGKQLEGARVKALDLRAGIALLLAGMTATGQTIIESAWQIGRGYEHLESKLEGLGVKIKIDDNA